MSLFRLARPRLTFTQQPTLLRTFFSTPHFLSSSEPQSATLLHRLKSDLKDAMRAKNKPRLDVLRTLTAEITNASKTAKPISTDTNLLSLLKKQIQACQESIEAFKSASREDLVGKENAQLEVLEGYVDEIPKLSEEDVGEMVEEVVKELREAGKVKESEKPEFGMLMGGVQKKIAGRPVDMQFVTERISRISGAPGGKSKKTK